jgi:hypothetical protein
MSLRSNKHNGSTPRKWWAGLTQSAHKNACPHDFAVR